MYLISILKQRLLGKWSTQSEVNLRNSFWGGLDFVVTSGSVFLLIPILLKTIGQEMFGVMVIVNTLMGFSGMFAFGLGQATLKFVADYRETGQVEQIVEVVRTTLWFYCITGLLACLVLFVLSEWLAQSVFQVSEDQIDAARFAIRAGGFGFLGFLVFGVAENTYKGYEEFQRPVVVRACVRVLTLCGQIGLALAGQGVAMLVGFQVLLYLGGACVLFICLKRELAPQLSFLPGISWSTLKAVFSYGFYTYLSGLFGMIRQSGDTLLVGAILGPSGLALYTIPIRLLSQVHALLSRSYGYLFPYVAKLYAKGDLEMLARCYEKSTFQISVISAGLITPIAVFAYPLLDFWLGAEIASKAGGVMQIMALRFAIFPLSIVNAFFLLGSGHVKVMTGVTGVNAVVSLSVIASMAHFYGLWGAAIGQLSVFVPVLLNRYIIEGKLLQTRNHIRIFMPPVLVIIPALFCYATNVISYSPETKLHSLYLAMVLLLVASGFIILMNLLMQRIHDRPNPS